ncbi:3-phosphoshikimate 1-carboxyvinyltransferase [Paratractidigestivibacter sp.]|uniref:3-phosphoshikimate 1-carboxyvinyltransferase n=1 Tax=Paratractidigestivibacter sp. TaxID=2847316 RepID=UPI002ABE7AB7|nr:3-phosphoshikimate 1-carboxyvinyltransferase [Paratractidigestivibacter sp.]
MDMQVNPSALGGTIGAIASKSEAHRLLICAAFADGVTDIDCNTTSQDIDATAACLRGLGARVTRTKKGFRVVPAATTARRALLDCGESGSTMRFLLPVVAALGCDASLTGHGRLPERPLSPLYEVLIEHGAELGSQGTVPMPVGGKVSAGRFEIAGNVSSQYVSGLLMAAPLMDGPVEVFVTEPVESLPYIDITCAALAQFGVEVSREKYTQDSVSGLLFRIPAGARYRTPGSVRVGGDWSNAAFWLAAGALFEGGITVEGVDMRSTQGDRAILGALALLGARVERGARSVTVRPDRLKGCRLDVSSCPDLVPPLAAMAACAQGQTTIVGAARLRIKESDRLQTVKDAVNALGGHVEQTNDGLVIDGVDTLTGGEVDAANDHRIAMMAAILAARAQAPTTIRGAQCVAKSYPAFFEDLRALGGSCQEV